jgi:DNA-directed RNA polymerase specialized sigma24 family protein
VIVLRYFVGLSDAEIARQVDAPPATVRWRLFAARNRLRTWLGARAE